MRRSKNLNLSVKENNLEKGKNKLDEETYSSSLGSSKVIEQSSKVEEDESTTILDDENILEVLENSSVQEQVSEGVKLKETDNNESDLPSKKKSKKIDKSDMIIAVATVIYVGIVFYVFCIK